jgi:uncharacterized protein (DUF58 family)
MTARGWWCLFVAFVLALGGVLGRSLPLIVTGLGLLLWVGWEWLSFSARVRTALRRLRVEREVCGERGPVSTLWSGRDFEVCVAVRLAGGGRLPWVAVADLVPFGVEHTGGLTARDGALSGDRPLRLSYQVRCAVAGLARFEGVRVELADLQGFFYHVAFVRDPVVFRILPGYTERGRPSATPKRHNQLPPPGVHRLRRPGSGSELLDLRDYLPGDPPRTIAWKVSARRDRLVTKEFESEVPVRCTLFLDASSSVRVTSPFGRRRPVDRLVELAAGVLEVNTAARDLTGLCLFDEQASTVLPPARGRTQHNRVLQRLAEAAALAPAAGRIDPDALQGPAYDLAAAVYPDLLRPEVNAMPLWLTWLVGFPGYRRRWRGPIDFLHRRKGRLLLLGTLAVPLALVALNAVTLAGGWLTPDAQGLLLGGSLLLVPLAFLAAWGAFLAGLLVGWGPRGRARRRKRLAALFAARYGPPGGSLEALTEDDDLYGLALQRFLAEHQVPYALPAYDEQGRYLPARPEKVGVLARALLRAVARGRDNELFVLMADLLELDGRWEPLLQAVRVALGRHHQVLVVCPWPAGLPLPGAGPAPQHPPDLGHRPAAGRALDALLSRVNAERFHAAYARLRQAFARLGVRVVCAGAEESASLILNRLERLRALGGRI